MKLVEKIIAIALLAVLAFGSRVFAAPDLKGTEGTRYEKAVTVLNALGIMQGYEDGTFRPEEKITRAEMSVIVVNMLGLHGSDFTAASTGFRDVTSDYWAAGSIIAATNLGIVSGTGPGIFEPEAPVTYAQAVKMVICMLGYDFKAEANGGYPVGYMSVAASEKITEGIALPINDNMTRGDVAILLYNACGVNYMKTTGVGRYTSHEATNGYTILSEAYGIYKDRGVVTANGITALYGTSSVGKDEVKISGEVYHVGNTNAKDLLGYCVSFYYQYDERSQESTILYIELDKNDVEKIAAEDIASYSGRELVYFDRETGHSKALSLPVNIDIIYNGASLTEPVVGSELIPQIGGITLVNNGSKDGYSVMLVESYTNYVVSSVDTNRKIIYGKYSTGRELNLDGLREGIDYVIKDAFGNNIPLDLLRKWDVLSVKKTMDGSYVDIRVTDTVVKGKVEEIADKTVLIDGVEYKISPSYGDANETLAVGNTGTFYLDIEGKIAGVSKDATAGDMAFLIDAGLNSGVGGKLKLKLLLPSGGDGEIKIFECADKITIGDCSLNGTQAYEELKDKKGIDYDADPNMVLRQVIKYKLNSEGQVQSIELPADKENGNRLYKAMANDGRSTQLEYFYYERSFARQVVLSNKTIVFLAPQDRKTDERQYKVKTIEYFTTGMSPIAEAYKASDKGLAVDAVAIFVPSGVSAGTVPKDDPVCVIDHYTRTVDEDGTEAYKLYGYRGSASIELLTTEDVNLNAITVGEGETAETVALGSGDVIRYSTDGTGRIDYVELVYSYTNNKAYNHGEMSVSVKNVYEKDNDANIIKTAAFDPNDSTPELKDIDSMQLDRFTIYVYDKRLKKDRISVGNVTDIRDYKGYGSSCSRVVIHRLAGDPRTLIVYN